MVEKAPEKPIWAKWKIGAAGDVEVVATYQAAGSYVQREFAFASLDEAARAFGPGFRDVVSRARAAGSTVGRWRP